MIAHIALAGRWLMERGHRFKKTGVRDTADWDTYAVATILLQKRGPEIAQRFLDDPERLCRISKYLNGTIL